MPDKLHLLMGVRTRKFALTLGGFANVSVYFPPGMVSYAPRPAANTWMEVVNVAGSGRLRGVALGADYANSALTTITLRVTLDGVPFSASVTVTGGNFSYVMNVDGVIGGSAGLGYCLLPEYVFESSLKVEVMRDSTAALPTLYVRHELEV